MKCDLLINAIGCIDGSLIDEAESYHDNSHKHRLPVWAWISASAACLCAAVLLIAPRLHFILPSSIGMNNHQDGLFGVVGSYAESYVDYRAQAQAGKVLITDELLRTMEDNKDTDSRKYEFSVRIIDANGARRDEISLSCLLPLGINDNERGEFISSGVISLSRKEIQSIKCPPQMALIVYPSRVCIGEGYLDTVGQNSLDVWIELDQNKELRGEYDYIREYDDLGSEERNKLIGEQISRYFETRYSAHVELDEDLRKFLEGYDNINTEFRHDLFAREISRFFCKKYAELMVNGDLVKEYIDSSGDFALDGEFAEFLREERVLEYLQKYADDHGIGDDAIKEYDAMSGTIRAELDTELIRKLLHDKRTRGIYLTEL